jgi:hypothetical protein
MSADLQGGPHINAGTPDDLPTLPENLEELPNIPASDVTVGSIITFKQLQLSEATNWQPTMSGYRTARVAHIHEPGVFELQLAERDRERKEIKYDYKGNRILAKFEMATNEEGEQDDGCVTLSYDEMVTPKLVAAGNAERNSPPAESSKNSSLTIDIGDIPRLVQGIMENKDVVMEQSSG